MNLNKIILLIVVCSITCIHSLNILSALGNIYRRTFRTYYNLIPQTKCIKGVGCFNNGPPWYQPFIRPFSAVPEDLHDIEYYLFTPQNPKKYYTLEDSQKSIQASPFNSTLPTKIITHGYNATKEEIDLAFDQKDALLSVGDYNVIVVNYTKYAHSPIYQAVANIRVLGVRASRLLKNIMKLTGVKAESMHCIGPSLGAQSCGYIGKRIPNFGRISGLSPAGPYFSHTAPEVHLTPSDALFVDTINTAEGGTGTKQHYGHQNFFPDGGSREPGCEKKYNIFNISQIIDENICAHNRGIYQYTKSINNTNCAFKAVKCKSYADFLNNKCPPDTSTVAVMGFHAKPISGIEPKDSFFLKTSSVAPYCVQNSEIPPNVSDVNSLIRENHLIYLETFLIRAFILGLNLE